MFGNSALFALHLCIPPILVEAAQLDGIVDELVRTSSADRARSAGGYNIRRARLRP